MIASLNIVAKTFAKITKTFVGLSMTIMATRRRPVLFLHLGTKYAKMDCKNGIYAKNWVRRTWTAKVNHRESQRSTGKSKSTINSLWWRQQYGVIWWRQLGLTWQWWCQQVTQWHVSAWLNPRRNFCQRVEGLMRSILFWRHKSEQDDSDDVNKMT